MAQDGLMTSESTMRAPAAPAGALTDAREFLCVDEFIRTLVNARALKTAFELGLVDHLLQQQPCGVGVLGKALGTDQAGLRRSLQ